MFQGNYGYQGNPFECRQQYPQQYPQQFQQQYQPQFQQQPMLAGRVVNSVDDITVKDVPNDGSTGWFPLADGTAVIGKYWTADGKIQTVCFKSELVSEPKPDPLMEKIDRILAAVGADDE